MKITILSVCFFTLISCAQFYSTWLTFSYSLLPTSEIYFKFEKGNYFPPMVQLGEGFYMWVTPTKIGEFNGSDGCKFNHNSLNIALWNVNYVELNLTDSYILNEANNKKGSIKYVESINKYFDVNVEKGNVKLRKVDSNAIAIAKDYTTKNNEPDAALLRTANRFRIELEPINKCADESFSIDFKFTDERGLSIRKVLYFYPVVFTKLDK